MYILQSQRSHGVHRMGRDFAMRVCGTCTRAQQIHVCVFVLVINRQIFHYILLVFVTIMNIPQTVTFKMCNSYHALHYYCHVQAALNIASFYYTQNILSYAKTHQNIHT